MVELNLNWQHQDRLILTDDALCRQGMLDGAEGGLAIVGAVASSTSSLTFLHVGGEAWRSSAFSLQHTHKHTHHMALNQHTPSVPSNTHA